MRHVVKDPGGLSGGARRRGVLPAALALCAGGALLAAAAEPDALRMEQRRTLESARYLHDIEGDTAAARALLDSLARSPDAEIRTQAAYFRAAFHERRGDTSGAARLYREALEGVLEPAQRRRAVARLLVLDPESVRPFRAAGKTRGLPARAFASPGPHGTEYVLVEESEGGAVRLQLQDARGMLHPLGVSLPADEEVLDAAPDRVLTRSAARQRVVLRRAPAFAPEVVLERFLAEEGALLAGESGEFLATGPREFRHVREGRVVFTRPLPGSGCSWRPAEPRARQGVFVCPGKGLYRADLARRTFVALPPGGEPPGDALLSGDYLLIRHADHVEARRGPAFDAAIWAAPAGLQDAIALGRGHAFIADGAGSLRALALRTGQPDWQREDAAASLLFHDGELLVLTHARTLLAVDERGRTLYAYEPAREGEEPALLPSREWVVVHGADGTRTRLNRVLLQIAGGGREHALRRARELRRQGDARGALRALDAMLAVEPGNGAAWREKAALLAARGAPRTELADAWKQAARSPGTAAWSADPALAGLAAGLGASWAWKRLPGPRFFPVLIAGARYAFYVENDNQSLIVLDNRTGAFKGSFRFPEALDQKAAAWMGDTLLVSSPTRLYLMAPASGAGILTQIPLRNPLCNALLTPRGLLVSDWNGNVQLLDVGARAAAWEARLGRGGVLLARGPGTEEIDAFEIEGAWHRLRLADGKAQRSMPMPPGTITEIHVGRDLAFAGYNEGLLVAVDRAKGSIAWQQDLGEQIFSLSGRGDQLLLAGTASKRLLNLHARTGIVQAQAQIATHLFNRPLLTSDGYWVGTTEPALEHRSVTHGLLRKYPLTDMPGTPTSVGQDIAVSTQDNFILAFPSK